MAHFQRGSKTSLERTLGIMYGYVGADEYDPVRVLTLVGGEEVITDMAQEGFADEQTGEEIRKSMVKAGVHPNVKSVTDYITKIELPEDFYSDWQITWEKCDDCEDDHGSLVNKKLDVSIPPNIDDIFSALEFCDELFQEEAMSLNEAIWILKEVAERFTLELQGTEPALEN